MATSEQLPGVFLPVEYPRGTHESKVDDKGRIKLPLAFAEYLLRYGERKVFVTRLEAGAIRIYPLPLWRQNEALASQLGDDLEEDILFVAQARGAEVEVDFKEGRLTFPERVRRGLDLESTTAMVNCVRGRLNVYTQAAFEERLKAAESGLAEKLAALTRKGFH